MRLLQEQRKVSTLTREQRSAAYNKKRKKVMADFHLKGDPEDLAEQEASAILQENPDSTSLMPPEPDDMSLLGGDPANAGSVPPSETASPRGQLQKILRTRSKDYPKKLKLR